jgi:hypothetical protein
MALTLRETDTDLTAPLRVHPVQLVLVLDSIACRGARVTVGSCERPWADGGLDAAAAVRRAPASAAGEPLDPVDLGPGGGAAARRGPEPPAPHHRGGPGGRSGGAGLVGRDPHGVADRPGRGRGPADQLRRGHGAPPGHGGRPGRLRAPAAPGGVAGDTGGDRLGGGPAAVRRAPAARGGGPARHRGLRLPLQGGLGPGHHRVRHGLRAGAPGRRPGPVPGGGHRRPGPGRTGPAVPGRRLPVGHGLRRGSGPRRDRGQLPVAGPRGGFPGQLPPGRDRRPPGPGWGAGGRDRAGHGRPAGHDRDRGEALRAGGLGRVLPPADDAGRRPPGVRQDLLDQPRAGRPLVPPGPHHPVRPARGRDPDGLGAPPGHLRGLRPAPAGRPRGQGGRDLRPGGAHPQPGVHAGHRVLRGCPQPGRRPGRRPGDRRGPGHGADLLGHRRGPPRHQAGQPTGPRRPPAAGRRVRAGGPPLPVAAGRRPPTCS